MILCNDKYINKKSLYTIRKSLTTNSFTKDEKIDNAHTSIFLLHEKRKY